MRCDATGARCSQPVCPAPQVRTLIGAVGLTVIGLKRVRIGGFRLPRSLGFGQFVPLKPNDIRRVLDRGICAQFTGIP